MHSGLQAQGVLESHPPAPGRCVRSACGLTGAGGRPGGEQIGAEGLWGRWRALGARGLACAARWALPRDPFAISTARQATIGSFPSQPPGEASGEIGLNCC